MLARGDSINLRRLDPQDLIPFQAYRNDPKIAEMQGWERIEDERALGFLSHMSKMPLFAAGEWTQIAIAVAATDHLLGDLGIHISEDQTEAELGITLSAPAQGQGLGMEACQLAFDLIFKETIVRRIKVITFSHNHAARALIARLGLQQTDTWDIDIDGVRCTELEFAVERPKQG